MAGLFFVGRPRIELGTDLCVGETAAVEILTSNQPEPHYLERATGASGETQSPIGIRPYGIPVLRVRIGSVASERL